MRPKIGVLAHPAVNDHALLLTHSIGGDYIQSLIDAGGLPVIIPVTNDKELLKEYTDECDGFLIPGGIDVNPICFNENPHPLIGDTNLPFDRFELEMIRLIREQKKPVLGICRGLQILNVAMGGSLWQDLSLQSENTFKHVQKEQGRPGISHKVDIEENSLLHQIFGKELYVNSFHHQALKDVGEGLQVVAKAPDGTIEAVEGKDYPYMVAVQWHPENFIVLPEKPMLKLFESFVEACGK